MDSVQIQVGVTSLLGRRGLWTELFTLLTSDCDCKTWAGVCILTPAVWLKLELLGTCWP